MDEIPPEPPGHSEHGPSPLSVRVEVGAGWVLVAPSGEVDVLTAADLAAGLRRAVAAEVAALDGAPGEVIVDLGEVSFLDARGLTVLASGAKQADAEGKRLVVTHPSTMVLKLLRITGLDAVVPVLDGG